LRPFNSESNSFYSECRLALESKYGRELEKAFAKACKLNEYLTQKKLGKNPPALNFK